MAGYPKAFTTSAFTQLEDGRYTASILESVHGLGAIYSVIRIIRRRESDLIWENVIPNYEISSNGDFTLYVDEPGTFRVYLIGDV